MEEVRPERAAKGFRELDPQRVSGETVRETLARGGIWPFFWSSLNRDIPDISGKERPQAIIVNTVITEPFRTRGKVIMTRSWERIVQGMRFLPRLLTEFGKLEIILTEVRDPVARRMYKDLAGYAWVRLHPVPFTYPVENQRILNKALRNTIPTLKKSDVVWVIDIQGVEAIGACLAEGLPLHQRVVVTGGPGQNDPRHHLVRIGTPLGNLVNGRFDPGKVRVLRGGLLTGTPVDPGTDSVQYDDDAFFFLPEPQRREFLSFLKPGFDRTSYLPCFASRFTGAPDRHITTSLRGERRPCIACGLCEDVCPAEILPQILHRYLYREAFDEAEKAGLALCVDCDLCTYVCPSKIELQKQFAEARDLIRRERGETLEGSGKALDNSQRGESTS